MSREIDPSSSFFASAPSPWWRMASPANAVVPIVTPLICNSNKVHYRLTWPDFAGHGPELRILIANDDCFRILHYVLHLVDHEAGNMRNSVQNKIPVGADKTRNTHILVVDAQVVTFAQKSLDYFNYRTLAQIIGAGFEAEAENADFPVPFSHNHLKSARHLQFVARQDRGDDWQFDIACFCLIGQGTEVLGQT